MEKRKIYFIGNAHLDPVWLWKYQEGYAEIKATYQSALDRIEQFGEFVFTSACAAYYEWVEENEPVLFEKIKAAVKAGKWSIAGGMWIQPDCNIPSGESFSRQMLISQRYFKEKFGLEAKTGYNVDSFGHNATLPQIFKKSGVENYIYMRPHDNGEKKYPFNGHIFNWRSNDGSEVTAYRIIHHGYGMYPGDDGIKYFEDKASADGEDKMIFYGVGNHGGGPTVKMIEQIEKYKAAHSDFEYIYAGPDAYFADIKSQNYALPTYDGDLQHHASGCYSANSAVKMYNREAESRLLTAEKYSVLASVLLGLDNKKDSEKLSEAWKNVLFNQFHDIMGGCSIKEAYDDVYEMYGESLSVAGKIINANTQKISWNIDTAKTVKYLTKEMDWGLWEQANLGTPLVIFNPLSWEVNVPVKINAKYVKRVEDSEGVPTDVQVIRASQTNGVDGSYNTLFSAKVPALGYATYWAYINGEPVTSANKLAVTENSLENSFVKIVFDKDSGAVISYINKDTNEEFIKGSAASAIVIDDDAQDTWSHDVFTFDKVVGSFGNAKFRILESGPVRSVLRVTTAYNTSELRQDFILYPHSTSVTVNARLINNEKLKMIKMCFGLDTENQTKVIYEIPYNHIEKPSNGEEEVAHKYAYIHDGKKGLALFNNGKYSHSASGNELRFVAARSCVYADHYGVHSGMRDEQYEYQDQGVLYFKYGFKGCSGDFKGNVGDITRKGYELNTTFTTIAETYHKGALPQKFSGISSASLSGSKIVTAVKFAEDNDGIIVRVVEIAGNHSSCTLDMPMLGIKNDIGFDAYEVKTLKITEDKRVIETLMTESLMTESLITE